MGILGDNKFNSSQQCASAAKVASCVLGCNGKGVALGGGERLFLSLVLGQSVQVRSHHFWASREMNGTALLEPVRLEGYQDGLGLERTMYNERPRELGLLTHRKRRLRGGCWCL